MCGHVFSQHEWDEEVTEPYEGVLLNGVCWAKSNVDKPGTFAKTPRTHGMLYQWNSLQGWLITEPVTGKDVTSATKDYWEPANDPCPTAWRLPTAEEAKSIALTSGTSNGWGTDIMFYLQRGKYLYFHCSLKDYSPIPKNGYWTSSGDANDGSMARVFTLNYNREKNGAYHFSAPRDKAYFIRCVAERCDSTVTHDTVSLSHKALPYKWRDTVFEEGTVSGTYCIQRRNCAHTDIAYLHLTVKSCPGAWINGVCWAKYNVDEPGRFANPDKPYGMLYQWNRRKGWPALYPDTVAGWDNSLEPGDVWEAANDPCPTGWRMPTIEELKTLMVETKVNRTVTVRDKWFGTEFTDITTGNTIFLPSDNYRDTNGVKCGSGEFYWSASKYYALMNNYFFQQCPYANGYSVRCVADEQACDIILTASERICQEDLPYTWHDTTFLENTRTGEYRFQRTCKTTGCDSIVYLYLTVDTLCGKPCKENGMLINDVCWATSNVDQSNTFADAPESFGLLYHWNKKKGFPIKGLIAWEDWGSDHINAARKWESANNPCPADWRIPNIREMYSLSDNLKVVRERTQENGVNGMRFTDKSNGNTIFLPEAGARTYPIDYGNSTDAGHYWSTTPYDNNSVYILHFYKSNRDEYIYWVAGFGALSVRCVAGRDTTGCGTIITDTIINICEKELPYEWEGTVYTESGIYEFQYVNATGCDSTVRLHLNVYQPQELSFFDAVCYGSDYHGYGFDLTAVTADTIVSNTLKTSWNCDSIRTLFLTVNPLYDIQLYDTICQGDVYSLNGFHVTAPGMHVLHLKSVHGCDSIVTLHLTVNPVYHHTVRDSVCPSERYDRHGFHLSDIRQSGTYTYRLPLQTVHECDSIITLELYVYHNYFYSLSQSICEGDTIDFRGRRLYESGIYYDSLRTIHKCDSIYSLDLTVHPVYDIQLTGVLCEGSPYTGYGFNVTEPGTHVLRLKTIHNCDSIVTLTLTEEKKVQGGIGFLLDDCSTHGYSFFLDPPHRMDTWQWDMGDGTVYRSEEGFHQYADSGVYRIQLIAETHSGCENRFSHVQHVPYYLPEVAIHADRRVIDEDFPTVRFHTDVPRDMTCEWDFGDGTTAWGDSVAHTFDATAREYYDVTLRVLNADSCVTENGMRIEVVFLPKSLNTFTPNGDGINDVFMAGYRIEVTDRNGLRIYAGDNGWDGTGKGGQAPQDTYFFRLYYRTANGERVKTGYVTLIR